MSADPERDRGVMFAHGVRVGAAACMLLLLVACGGESGGERPTPSITASVTASATRSPTLPSPTRSVGERESRTATASAPSATSPPSSPSSPPTTAASPTSSRSPDSETEPPSDSPSETPTETPSDSPTELPSPTASATAEASDEVEGTPEESSGVPAWVWWLLALLLVAGAVSIPLIVRARRRNAWLADLSANQTEVAWFARVLIPQVRGAGSPEAAAGAWRVAGEARVAETEDRLTALEATAPDEASRDRATVLRDTVRAARARMATVVTTSTEQTLAADLDDVAAQIELALPNAEQPSLN